MSYNYVTFAFGFAVFIYVQYALYSNKSECKRKAPELFVWLLFETIVFYV